jgi:hypothetical protein
LERGTKAISDWNLNSIIFKIALRNKLYWLTPNSASLKLGGEKVMRIYDSFFFQEFAEAPVLFCEGSTRFDVNQGHEGGVATCWYLSILAAIAHLPQLIGQVRLLVTPSLIVSSVILRRQFQV